MGAVSVCLNNRLWIALAAHAQVGCWHKADIAWDALECPLSGAKQTFRKRLTDVRF